MKTTYLITAYNAEHTIEVALASIEAQTLPADGVIVVDDGSTDDTVARVRRWAGRLPLEVVELERSGRAIALNRGVDATRTELISILDADDAAVPRRSAIQQPAFRANPRLGVHGGAFYQVTAEPRVTIRRRTMPGTDAEIRRALAYSGPFCHSCVTYRRRAIVEAGGFRPALRSRIDQDLWVRVGALGYELENVIDVLAAHIKSDSTYFASVNTTSTRTATMFARNLAAISHLDLPRTSYLSAVARLAVSLAPPTLTRRWMPGLDAVSWSDFVAGIGDRTAAGLARTVEGS